MRMIELSILERPWRHIRTVIIFMAGVVTRRLGTNNQQNYSFRVFEPHKVCCTFRRHGAGPLKFGWDNML